MNILTYTPFILELKFQGTFYVKKKIIIKINLVFNLKTRPPFLEFCGLNAKRGS